MNDKQFLDHVVDIVIGELNPLVLGNETREERSILQALEEFRVPEYRTDECRLYREPVTFWVSHSLSLLSLSNHLTGAFYCRVERSINFPTAEKEVLRQFNRNGSIAIEVGRTRRRVGLRVEHYPGYMTSGDKNEIVEFVVGEGENPTIVDIVIAKKKGHDNITREISLEKGQSLDTGVRSMTSFMSRYATIALAYE